MTDQTSIVRATEITTAWLANPHTRPRADEVGALLASVHAAVEALAGGRAPAEPEPEPQAAPRPAVGAKASLKIVGRIISMIDGKPYASLTRHLRAHGMTHDQYRQRFKLPTSYPMVAPAYSEARSAIARQLGFGRGGRQADAQPEPQRRAKSPRRAGASDATKAAKAHLTGEA